MISWFDLTSTQDKGLEFWQMISNAIVLYDPMPSECLVTALNWVKSCEELQVLYRKIVLHPQLAPRVIVESKLLSRAVLVSACCVFFFVWTFLK